MRAGEDVTYVQVALPASYLSSGRSGAGGSGSRRQRSADAEDAVSATIGVYAGMSPSELAKVLRLALRLPPTATFSAFSVREQVPTANNGASTAFAARNASKKQRKRAQQANGGGAGTVKRRIVPLSLACRAPEVLRGVSDGLVFLLDNPTLISSVFCSSLPDGWTKYCRAACNDGGGRDD